MEFFWLDSWIMHGGLIDPDGWRTFTPFGKSFWKIYAGIARGSRPCSAESKAHPCRNFAQPNPV